MSESPKINNSGALGPLKDSKPKKDQPELDLKPQQESQRKQETLKQNQIYSKPAETIRVQADQPAARGHDLPELISSEQKPPVKSEPKPETKTTTKDIKIDQQVLARNPVLAAQLQNRKQAPGTSPNKPKKPAPKPNSAPGFGKKDIPARFLRTQLPGRLKGLSDEPIDTLDKLKTALEARLPEQDPRLITAYAKTLMNSSTQEKSASIAETFGFDENIAQLDLVSLREFLTNIIEEAELEPAQRAHIEQLLVQLRQGDSELLRALVSLFLPLPLPYTLREEDEEFYMAERELYEDSSDEDSEQEQDDEDEQQALPALSLPQAAEAELSVAVRSINYGKLHLVFNSDDDNLKLRIKSDAQFDELGLAIELALEDAASGCDYRAYHWRDSVLRLSETRDLQLSLRGSLNPNMLRALNSVLHTIYVNDADALDADFKVL